MLYQDNKYYRKYPNHPNFLEIALLLYFATHVIDRNLPEDYNEVRNDFISLPKIEFLSKYKEMIKDEWQKEKPRFHRNWFDYARLRDLLLEAGFKKVIKSECRKSIFVEMCASDFDTSHPEMSLYVDAIK